MPTRSSARRKRSSRSRAAGGARSARRTTRPKVSCSIYNFKQSIDDGNTVPLYYENRIPELQLTNPNLTENMAEIIESADLDEDQQAKLEREFAREYQLITREERLE